jgi:predicted component of type VI protein secretion system
MARLVIYSSGAVNQTLELTGRNVRIGRAKENDVVLADASQVVSRFHAELRYEDGRYILLDLNSANGTWVWDHRIQRMVLDSGTVAEIGSYRLAIEADTAATTVPPASRHSVPPGPTAPQKVVSGALGAGLLRDSPEQSPPPTRVPIPPPRVEPPPVPVVAPAPPKVSAPVGVADDSVSTAARVITQPAAEASTTGLDRGGRSARIVWPSKPMAVAGTALLGVALVAVGIAIGVRLMTGEQGDHGTRPGSAPSATAPAEPQAISGPPVEPPVVPVATSAEKQEVGAPAVPAPPAEARLDAVRVVPGLARRAGESQAEYTARAGRLRALYGDARAALQAKEFGAAVRLFERLETDQPGLLDVAVRLAEARDGLRASRRATAEAAMAGGAAAEQRGDLVEAQREFERASEADPASGADEALGRVRARMKTLGDDALKRARTFDALGRTEDAIAQYERAVQLLAPDDPNRRTAKQRLDVLRAGIIK